MTVGTVHETSPMSSEPPPRLSSSFTGSSSLPQLVVEPVLVGRADLLLHRLGQRLIVVAPLAAARRAAMLANIASATGLLKCCGQAAPTNPRGPRRAGHQRRALRHLVAEVPHLLDVRVVGLAEEVPDRRLRRHDVRLIAAVGDDVVRALLEAEVLAPEVPAGVHQLHGVERAAAAPGRAGAVRGLARRTCTRPRRGRWPPVAAPRRPPGCCRRARTGRRPRP